MTKTRNKDCHEEYFNIPNIVDATVLWLQSRWRQPERLRRSSCSSSLTGSVKRPLLSTYCVKSCGVSGEQERWVPALICLHPSGGNGKLMKKNNGVWYMLCREWKMGDTVWIRVWRSWALVGWHNVSIEIGASGMRPEGKESVLQRPGRTGFPEEGMVITTLRQERTMSVWATVRRVPWMGQKGWGGYRGQRCLDFILSAMRSH